MAKWKHPNLKKIIMIESGIEIIDTLELWGLEEIDLKNNVINNV